MTSYLCSTLAGSSGAERPDELLKRDRPTVCPNEATGLDCEALFIQFSPLVNRLIRQYGRTPEMRQDLIGELYCLFYTLLDRFDPSRGVPLHAYLVRQLDVSTYTYARKHLRHRHHEAPLWEGGEDHPGLRTADPTPQWESQLLQQQIAVRLPALIRALPRRQRQVVILRYCEDRSFEEIAQRLQIKPASARSLLRFGLNRLRAQMACDPDRSPVEGAGSLL